MAKETAWVSEVKPALVTVKTRLPPSVAVTSPIEKDGAVSSSLIVPVTLEVWMMVPVVGEVISSVKVSIVSKLLSLTVPIVIGALVAPEGIVAVPDNAAKSDRPDVVISVTDQSTSTAKSRLPLRVNVNEMEDPSVDEEPVISTSAVSWVSTIVRLPAGS